MGISNYIRQLCRQWRQLRHELWSRFSWSCYVIGSFDKILIAFSYFFDNALHAKRSFHWYFKTWNCTVTIIFMQKYISNHIQFVVLYSPCVGVYMTSVMSITTGTVVVCVIVINLDAKGEKLSRAPKWLRRITQFSLFQLFYKENCCDVNESAAVSSLVSHSCFHLIIRCTTNLLNIICL